MPTEPTSSYQTLRRTRTVLRALAPIASAIALLTGLTMFAGVAPRLISFGFSTSERLILATVALGYLIGAPVVAFVLFFLLRAGADLIDLWIDQGVSAEKTANLMERQLVPGILRMCQLLEKTGESTAALNATPPLLTGKLGSSEECQKAIEAVQELVRHESWNQAKRQAAAVAERFPDSTEAKGLLARVEAEYGRRVQGLRELLDEAVRANDAEAILNSRDRLSGYLAGSEFEQLDRRVARVVASYLREALAEGKAREIVHLAERVVDVLGDSTSEGAQVRAALPTLRRSAGLCPECGEPYDVSLVRCATCESKRAKKPVRAKP